MKNRIAILLLSFLPACMPQCTKSQVDVAKVVTRNVIETALAVCIAENAWMAESKLQEACRIADDLMPLARDILSAHKRGMAKAKLDGGS